MIGKKIKNIVQNFAHKMGYHVLSKNGISGDMTLFLKGIKARNLVVKNILDIGANRAEWSELASSIFNDASFYLIEPQKELSSDLDNFFKNHKGAWFLGGAGAKDGELTLSMWDDLAGSSFLLPENENSDKKQRKVPIFAIDTLIKENKIPIPDICKIDVQGFELEVLKGAEVLFGKTEVFILEASLFKFSPNQPLLHEIIEFMTDRNYFIYDFAGFANRPLDKALGQVDICFVKEGSQLRENHGW